MGLGHNEFLKTNAPQMTPTYCEWQAIFKQQVIRLGTSKVRGIGLYEALILQ